MKSRPEVVGSDSDVEGSLSPEATVEDCHTRHNIGSHQITSPHLKRAYEREKPTPRKGCEHTIDKHCWTTAPKPELGDQGLRYAQPLSLPLCEAVA